MSSTTSNESFFEKVEDVIVNIFHKAPAIEQTIAKFADAAVNEIKALQGNATVQLLENGFVTVAEAVDPGLTPMIAGLELEWPKLLNLVTGVVSTIDTEAAKPVADQVNDALAKLNAIKGINSTIYGNLLAALNSAIQNFVNTNNGIVATPAQTNAAALAVHSAAA